MKGWGWFGHFCQRISTGLRGRCNDVHRVGMFSTWLSAVRVEMLLGQLHMVMIYRDLCGTGGMCAKFP